MRLDRYLAKSRIIDIESADLEGALGELLKVATERVKGKVNQKQLLSALLERENTMTTYLGDGVAMPYIRTHLSGRNVFAVGRCIHGLDHDGSPNYKEVKLIVLLLASDKGQSYVNMLASMARLLKEKALVDEFLEAPDLDSFRDRVIQRIGGLPGKPEAKQSRINRFMIKEAERVFRHTKCSHILLFSDTFGSSAEVTSAFPRCNSILVTQSATDRYLDNEFISGIIEVRSFAHQRLSQLRSAVLIGLTRDIFKYNDKLCCIGGIPGSNQLDTLIVVDVEKEFRSLLTRDSNILPGSVKVEVLERVFAIATELAVEGREGRPIGSLFVVGDTEKVNALVKPLVLNPFYGYKEEDRNVLNPFMDETVKELSSIDGAFVIRGNGVVESAGSLINTSSDIEPQLPGGFGTRHAAASAISLAADCIAITVSASSGQVTLFRKGVMLPLLERSAGALV